MKRFADLYDELDRTTSTNAKVAAIVRYLHEAPPGDAAWALFFLTGRRLTRLLPSRLLHEWTIELSGLAEWLVRESYSVVGDYAETIALLLDGRVRPADPDSLRQAAAPSTKATRLPFGDEEPFDTHVNDVSLAEWIERRILPLRTLDDGERRVRVMTWWTRLSTRELFLLNKLLTGEFRVGVSHTLVVRALAERAALPTAVVEHRLMGNWEPSAEAFMALLAPGTTADEPSQPYPFCLASPLDLVEGDVPITLGERRGWLAEWKWDGIRAQLIRRAGQVFLWSRGEEVITDRFPEVVDAAAGLPDGIVLDGEVLAFEHGVPRPFADLQRRIGRQRRVREVAAHVPAAFVAYDLLQENGIDIRDRPLRERRERLIALLEAPSRADLKVGPYEAPDCAVRISEALDEATWEALASRRAESRARGVEGLMLKRWSSPYRAGRKRGDWWKWKIEPHSIDVVLIYAQPGSGRRASLFTDYTFGVWHEGELVPVAKAYSGLTDDEIDELDRWIRRHTTERFGPVSAVEPMHVFELGFERIAASTRHPSGVAVRFPRMLRWRRDKTAAEADTLDTLKGFLRA
jgi:DNA ligase-1